MRNIIPAPFFILTLFFCGVGIASLHAEPLPGTLSLEWEEADLSDRLMEGAHTFVERKIAEANTARTGLELDREQFKKFIGCVDALATPTKLEFFGEKESSLVAESAEFSVHQVRWQVLEDPGVIAEGLLVNPRKTDPETAPALVLLPDAGDTPEDLLGIGGRLLPEKHFGSRFASAGFRLLIPCTISRDRYEIEGDTRLKKSDQTHREWIYRQGFQMGRHVIGYEVQIARAAASWLRDNGFGHTVGVAGYGEGGLVALYAAAADPTIEHALVSGYFGPKDAAWSEPIYRNIFHRLSRFGDVEIAKLIAPRPLLIEHSVFPEIEDQKGAIAAPTAEAVEAETEKLSGSVLFATANGDARADFPAVAAFAQEIGFQTEVARLPPISLLIDQRREFDPRSRHGRVFRGMENHVQSLVQKADDVRYQRFFLQAEPELDQRNWTTERDFRTLDPADFVEKSKAFREEFRNDLIGRFDEEFALMIPRSRQILENEEWTAWDVVLPVYGDPEEEFFAWGVLIVPKGLTPEDKRPVVVCQHGRNGVPLDTVNAGKTGYSDFAARMAERGYITFSPHHLYRGEDRYRWLDRKANTIGCTLFSFLVDSHERILDWLKTQPNVDPDRIAFYGLSYGGESAMRIPAVLEGYALSICSGDFNQWTRKVASTTYPNGFMRSIEWEMPYWNLGNTFDYAEMAGLIFPRPFMVERGHHDRVAPDSWVAHEYAKVRWLYAQFGLSSRTAIEFFQGGHSIRGDGTFEFLDRHLKTR